MLAIPTLPLSKQLTTTTDGSAGIIIQYPSGATQTASSATGKHCTNYRSETEALQQAAILVEDSLEPCYPTVFLTDALSVLEDLHFRQYHYILQYSYHIPKSSKIIFNGLVIKDV